MTLSFSQKFPDGTPNYFIEKIWRGLPNNLDYFDKNFDHLTLFDREFDKPEHNSSTEPYSFPPKIHTIREDSKGRWWEGMDIHMVINNRTKDRFQFAPIIKCTGTQSIEIQVWPEIKAFHIQIDGRRLSDDEVKELAVNDGFDSVDQFLNYFRSGIKGKLIHWTDKQY